jgi:hypothetical protein
MGVNRYVLLNAKYCRQVVAREEKIIVKIAAFR